MEGTGGKVFVGVSGGVDSAVTLHLLKKKYNVVGVFIKGWEPPFIECRWRKEREDAMRVCAHAGVPFHTLDCSDSYEREVIKPFIEGYRRGETPNPDIFCNSQIKFGEFISFAKKHNAKIATGHYARVENGHLYTGVDKSKDQSYFLWNVRKEALLESIFPLGSMKKEKVRSIAKKLGIPTADKKDSTGICFIGEVDIKQFLSNYIKPKEGPVIYGKRNIGSHDGVWWYTEGQRHGFENNTQLPLFVINKDIETNTLFVEDKKGFEAKKRKEHKLRSVILKEKLDVESARIRHLGELLPATYSDSIISFSKDQYIAPGQSIAFYNKDECIGGGIVTIS